MTTLEQYREAAERCARRAQHARQFAESGTSWRPISARVREKALHDAELEDLAASVLSALASGEKVLVPKVPTPGMLEVGGRRIDKYIDDEDLSEFKAAEDTWAAMIAAAGEQS